MATESSRVTGLDHACPPPWCQPTSFQQSSPGRCGPEHQKERMRPGRAERNHANDGGALSLAPDHAEDNDEDQQRPIAHVIPEASVPVTVNTTEPVHPGNQDPPLPRRQRSEVTDGHPNSPWAHKTIVSLDGGGIRGYSALLIIKRLMKIIAEIEGGTRPGGYHSVVAAAAAMVDGLDGPGQAEHVSTTVNMEPWYYAPNRTSAYYPWFHGDPVHEHSAATTPAEAPLSARIRDEAADEDIERTTEDSPGTGGFYPCHYFDYMAGTSTGGLTAIMLGRLRMLVDEALAQYKVVGDRVFGHPRPLHRHLPWLKYLTRPKYRAKYMEDAIVHLVDQSLKEELQHWRVKAANAPFRSDPMKCRTLVAAYGHNLDFRKTHIFRSYDIPLPPPFLETSLRPMDAGLAAGDPIWKIARATSAAPGYFSSISFGGCVFVDGGLGLNNPAEEALNEVRYLHEHPPSLLVSVGTGKTKSTRLSERQPRSLSRAGLARTATTPPPATGLTKFRGDLNDAVNLATQSEQTAERVERLCGDMRTSLDYFRLNVEQGLGEIQLDEWLPADGGATTRDNITQLTNAYLRNPKVNGWLLHCARALVARRRHRAQTERWEQYAADYLYLCPEESCKKSQLSKIFPGRQDLREHGINKHFVVPLARGNEHRQPPYPTPCPHDSCLDVDHTFSARPDLLSHVREVHQVDTVMDAPEMERWLDAGRTSTFKLRERRRVSLCSRNRTTRSTNTNGAATSPPSPRVDAHSNEISPTTINDNDTTTTTSRRRASRTIRFQLPFTFDSRRS